MLCGGYQHIDYIFISNHSSHQPGDQSNELIYPLCNGIMIQIEHLYVFLCDVSI